MSKPLAQALQPEHWGEYQTNPTAVVSAIVASEISSRARSSVRWSTSDMVPSGLARLRRRRGSSRLNRPVVRTVSSRWGAAAAMPR